MFALTIAPNIAFNHTGIITVLQFLVGLVSTELVFVLRLYTVLKFTLWLLHRHDMLEIIFHSHYINTINVTIYIRGKKWEHKRGSGRTVLTLSCALTLIYLPPHHVPSLCHMCTLTLRCSSPVLSFSFSPPPSFPPVHTLLSISYVSPLPYATPSLTIEGMSGGWWKWRGWQQPMLCSMHQERVHGRGWKSEGRNTWAGA